MLMQREQAVPADITTTTFGPLDKYVAANDNVPVVEGESSAGFAAGGFTVGNVIPAILSTEYKLPSDRVDQLRNYLPKVGEVCVNNGELCVFDGIDFAPTVPPRTGDFMQVFSGRKYWPMDPRPHEVHIEDIAHSLAMQARYAGHCIKFYSVAEHSVLIARHLAAKHAPEVALAGLLHDAPEAYCVDIPRPLKPYLTNYRAIEQDNWLAIAARFQLDRELPREVHDTDNRIIADELVNLREMPWHARYAGKKLGVKLRYWSPEEAELEFLATFDALMAGRA
ncbi:hypothetical protein [Agrobacterium pusense]|uniref:hypothetical protein n=1 Tax=Agrobacterium pusense TaxID=648995 RepID=UPI0015A571B5|nr:hypothetical protein [Agrobacterium pusense]